MNGWVAFLVFAAAWLWFQIGKSVGRARLMKEVANFVIEKKEDAEVEALNSTDVFPCAACSGTTATHDIGCPLALTAE